MPRPRFTFTVRVVTGRSNMDLAGLFDMMRYDGATVLDWTREPAGSSTSMDYWTLTLTSDRYTPDRWSSFGLYPTLK